MENKDAQEKEITRLSYTLEDINSILAALSTIPVYGKQSVQNMNFIYTVLTEQMMSKNN